jgi:hypothetical protein
MYLHVTCPTNLPYITASSHRAISIKAGQLNISLKVTQKVILRMTDHDFLMKDLITYPLPGITNEDHKHTSVRTAGLQTRFEYETSQTWFTCPNHSFSKRVPLLKLKSKLRAVKWWWTKTQHWICYFWSTGASTFYFHVIPSHSYPTLSLLTMLALGLPLNKDFILYFDLELTASGEANQAGLVALVCPRRWMWFLNCIWSVYFKFLCSLMFEPASRQNIPCRCLFSQYPHLLSSS